MSVRGAALALAGLSMLAAGSGRADEVMLSDGLPSESYTVLIGDKKQWDTPVNSGTVSSASGYLSVASVAENNALKATWSGKGEAQLFIASQGPQDLSAQLEADAALVMLIQVNAPPRKKVKIRMGCGYPCAANADISKLLKALPEDEWFRVSFDLQCFAGGGLNVRNVDVPLLLTTRGKMALTIADVRFVPGAGPDATVNCR